MPDNVHRASGEAHLDREAANYGFREAARRGRPLSQRITPAEVARVRAGLDRRGGLEKFLADAGLDDVLEPLVTGQLAANELRANSRTALADLTKEVRGGRTLWLRKVAAAIYGLRDTQARGVSCRPTHR